MFEQGLSFLLKKLLRDFVEDGDNLNEKVQVGVWSGLIVLEDLVLKNSIFNLLELPITLNYGYIGRFELHIPWSRLGSEPVTVVLDKVYILVEPKYEWNPGAADRREQGIKQAKLAAAELFASQRLEGQGYGSQAKSWFLGALLSKIIDKIQITIRGLHVRYEDKMSCPSEFTVGFSFQSLSLLSGDQASAAAEGTATASKERNYDQELLITGADAFHKLVALNNLAVYWNPLQAKGMDVCCSAFCGRSAREIQTLMDRTIVTWTDKPRHHFILNPVDVQANLDMQVNIATGQVKAKVKVLIASISISLEDKQLREIISMAINMANFSKLEKFSEHRPRCAVKEDPLAWWRYAIHAVLVELRSEKKKQFTWERLRRRIGDKLVYIELWKSRLASPSSTVQMLGANGTDLKPLDRASNFLYCQLLSAGKKKKAADKLSDSRGNAKAEESIQPLDAGRIDLLQRLEADLSFEDILFFRSLAEMQAPADQKNESWLGSLVSWASGRGNSTDEERGKLIDALKYDPDHLFRGGAAKVDANEVVSIIDVHLKKGSITLSLSPPEASNTFQGSIPFLQFTLQDLCLKTVAMGDEGHMRIHTSLQEVEGFELQPAPAGKPGQLVQHRFIFRRNLKIEKSAGSESNWSEPSTASSATKLRAMTFAPLFAAVIETFPGGSDVEVSVRLDLEELEMWLSPTARWIDSVVIFATWPEEMAYWSEMEMKALNQFDDLKLRVNAKMDYIMNNHANIVIEGKIQAPIVVIHDHRPGLNCKANLLVIDLGVLSLHTQKLAKAQRTKELEALQQFSAFSPSVLAESIVHKEWDQQQLATPKDLDLLFGDQEDQSQMDYMEASGRRSSIFHKYGEHPDEGYDSAEEELFDIFLCKISHIEVYFVEAIVNCAVDGTWNVQYEIDKTVMVERFEINVEIQVSALPWDITLPPAKLFVDIPEINIQLSDAKILRMVQFVAQMLRSSAAAMVAKERRPPSKKIKPSVRIQGIDPKDKPALTREMSKARPTSLPPLPRGASKKRRKSRGKSMGEASSVFSDSRSALTGDALDALGRSTDYQSVQDGDDSDDDSFFSVEDGGDKSLADLKYTIAQRETMHTKLVTDLRLTELDAGKVALQESIKKELAACEMELHQLKVSYVEMLMKNSDYLESLAPDLMDADHTAFDQHVQNMLEPKTNNQPATTARKRDMIQASVFKLTAPVPLDLESGPNKELFYMRVNIQQINIDLLCGVDGSSAPSSPKAGFLRHNCSSFEVRLGLTNFGCKLRHRLQDSRISAHLRDIVFSEQLSPGRKVLDIHRPLTEGGVPLITSDPSYSQHSRQTAVDLLKVKYEIFFGSKEEDKETPNRHALKVALGYLAVNFDQQRIVPLVLWGQDLQDLLQESIGLTKPPPAQEPAELVLPVMNASIKLDSISMSWINGSAAVMNATLSAIKADVDMNPQYVQLSAAVVDFSVFDLAKRKRSANTRLGASNMIFGRNVATEAPLLQVALRAHTSTESEEEEPWTFKGTVRAAPIVVDVQAAFVEALSKEIVHGALLPVLNKINKSQTSAPPVQQQPQVSLESMRSQLLGQSIGSVQLICGGLAVVTRFDNEDDDNQEACFSLHSMRTTLSWGTDDAAADVQVTMKMADIGLSIGGENLIDPLEISLFVFLQSSGLGFHAPISRVFALHTMYPPDLLPAMLSEEVQAMLSVSPIRMHYHRAVHGHAVSLASAAGKWVEQLSVIWQPPRPPIDPLQLLVVRPVVSDELSAVPFKTSISLKIYEVGVLLEEQELGNKVKFSAELQNIVLTAILPKTSDSFEAEHIAEVSFRIGRLQVDDVSTFSVTRSLLESGDDGHQVILHTPTASPTRAGSRPSLADNFLTGQLDVSSDAKYTVSLGVNELRAVVLAGSIVSLVDVINGLTSTRRQRLASAGAVTTSSRRKELYAHPSSEPMAPPNYEEQAVSAPEEQVLPLTIASFDSFWNEMVGTVTVTLDMAGLEVSVPTGDEDHAAALVAKTSLQCSMVLNRPAKDDVLDVLLGQSASNVNLLSAHVQIPSVQVFLAEGQPAAQSSSLITPRKASSAAIKMKKLLELDLSVSASTCLQHRPWQATASSAKQANFWVLREAGGLFLHSKVEVEVNQCEVRAFLDYRPLLKLNNHLIVPLMGLSTPSTPAAVSSNSAASSPTNSSKTAPPTTRKRLVLNSSADMLAHIADLSDLEATVTLREMVVVLVNDVLPRPLSIVQLTALDTKLTATVPYPTRQFHWLLLEAASSRSAPQLLLEEEPLPKALVKSASRSPLDMVKSIFGRRDKPTDKPAPAETSACTISVAMDMAVSVEYFNQKLLAVEPLIEPFDVHCSFTALRTAKDNHEAVLYLFNADSKYSYFESQHGLVSAALPAYQRIALPGSSNQADNSYPPHLSVKIPSINANVTMGLLDMAFVTAKSAEALDKMEGSSTNTTSANLVIRNESGMPIRYWSKQTTPSVLASSCEESVCVDEDDCVFRHLSLLNKSSIKSINLAVQRSDGSFGPAHMDITLEGVGFRILTLNDHDKKSKRRPRAASITNTLPPLVLELASRNGCKLLVVRSTMRVFNATARPFYVRLVDSKPHHSQQVLWECFLPPGKGFFVPAELCTLPAGHFIVSGCPRSEDGQLDGVRVGSANFPCPAIPGFSTPIPMQEPDASTALEVYSPTSTLQNELCWRKKVKEEGVNTLSYAHWISMVPAKGSEIYEKLASLPESICANIQVESKGMPLKKQSAPSACMIRNVKLLAPIRLVNLLSTAISVAILPDLTAYGCSESMDSLLKFGPEVERSVQVLRSGESYDCLSLHAREACQLAFKYHHDTSNALQTWTSFVKIPGCSDESRPPSMMLQVDVPFKNESHLTLHVEVVDKDGTRTCSIFAPFWIVSASFLPLQFQHETAASSKAEKQLNGCDGLAADQIFDEISSSQAKSKSIDSALPPGIGRARGMNGIIIGPDAPIKGLSDFLYPTNNHRISAFHRRPLTLVKPEGSAVQVAGTQDLTASRVQSLISRQRQQSVGQDSKDSSWYALAHCGYSSQEKKTARIRFRHHGAQWSRFISIDALGQAELTIETDKNSKQSSHEDDTSNSVNSPFFKDGQKVFSFGVIMQTLEPPFHRTTAVVLVDQYTMINAVGQSIEVKQAGQDNVFTLHPTEEAPIWWRNGAQLLQVRIARYGWSWSGKISLATEGDFPVRLRNDYDHTVFFVLILVSKVGPKVSVTFQGQGYEQISPYRFENHTVETFRIQQVSSNKAATSQLTNLLPYHACAYAWDEPLAPQRFTVHFLANALQSQDDWQEVGTFSFERLEYLQHGHGKKLGHLVMRVVAQGPTRVFQIYDNRLGSAAASTWQSSKRNGMYKLLTVAVEVGSLGVSVVDQRPEELLYLSLQGLAVSHCLERQQASTSVSVKKLQLDNQLWSTPYPSIIHPLRPTSSRQPADFLSLQITQSFEYSGILVLPEFSFYLAPFDVNIEGSIVGKLISMALAAMDLLDEATAAVPGHGHALSIANDYDASDAMASSVFVLGSSHAAVAPNARTVQRIADLLDQLYRPDNKSQQSSSSSSNSLARHVVNNHLTRFVRSAPAHAAPASSKIYFQRFLLSEIKCNVSFNAVGNSGESDLMDGYGWLAHSQQQHSKMLAAVIQLLLHVAMTIGSTVLKVSNCPLRFEAVDLQHVFVSSQAFSDMLVSRYLQQGQKQWYVVLFSLELIGSPFQFYQLVKEGLWDFVYFPTAGLFTSPQDFLIGAIRGTHSLVTNVVASAATTCGKFMGSLQVGLIASGAVDSYPAIEDAATEEQPKLLITEAGEPADLSADGTMPAGLEVVSRKRSHRPASLMEAMKMAVAGVVMDPFTGFRADGPRGLLLGSLKGSFGLLARPLYGLLGAGSFTMDSISYYVLPCFLANQKLRLMRARPPRYFLHPNQPLQIYSAAENMGLQLLSRLGAACRHEALLWHGKLGEQRSLLLTKARIMIVADHFDHTAIIWQCLLGRLLSIEVDYSTSSSVQASAEQQEETKMLSLLRMLDDKTLSGGFQSRLTGQPTLKLYHLPADGTSREGTATRMSAGLSDASSLLRYDQQAVLFSSHEQLLQLLHKLLRICPSLASADILTYLEAVGVDVSLAKPSFSGGMTSSRVRPSSASSSSPYHRPAGSNSLFSPPSPMGLAGMKHSPRVEEDDSTAAGGHSRNSSFLSEGTGGSGHHA